MHARVTTIEGSPDRADAGIDSFRSSALSVVRGLDGFKGALLLVDRNSGKGLAATLWESEAAMRASEEAVTGVRQEASQAMGASQPSVDRYEVAILEMP